MPAVWLTNCAVTVPPVFGSTVPVTVSSPPDDPSVFASSWMEYPPLLGATEQVTVSEPSPSGIVMGSLPEVMLPAVTTGALATGHVDVPPSEALTKASSVAAFFEQATTVAHASTAGHA